jgi:hypothetical protein
MSTHVQPAREYNKSRPGNGHAVGQSTCSCCSVYNIGDLHSTTQHSCCFKCSKCNSTANCQARVMQALHFSVFQVSSHPLLCHHLLERLHAASMRAYAGSSCTSIHQSHVALPCLAVVQTLNERGTGRCAIMSGVLVWDVEPWACSPPQGCQEARAPLDFCGERPKPVVGLAL